MTAEVMNRAEVPTEESEYVRQERLLEALRKHGPSPGLLTERFLTEGSDLVPSGEGELKLDIEHTKRFIFAREETVQIKTPTHEPYAGGACFKEHRKLFFGQTTIALHDKNDRPVALCVQERDNAFTICGTRPLINQDAPLLMENEHAWYRWYQVKKKKQGVTNYNPIFVCDGTEFKHFLRAVPMEKKFHELGPTEKCDIVIEAQEEEVKLARFTKKRFSEDYKTGAADGWHLSVTPGVDPAAMLCVSVALDYMIIKPYRA